MPLPALIAAGGAIAGGAINAASTGKQNRKSREFTREMYALQKHDNLEFWNMQNDYNSPAAQMSRYQEAGLNPNLIYGQGSGGSAGAVQTPDVKQPEFRVPEWGSAISAGANAGLDAFYDTQIKQATVDNLKRQGTVLEEEALLKAAQTRATGAGADRSVFDLGLETDLRDTSFEYRRELLRKLHTDIDLSINKDAREAAQNSSSLREAAERILSMQSQRGVSRAQTDEIRKRISLMEKDGVLKDLDIELRKQGINPQDPLWARVVGRLLSNFFDANGSISPAGGSTVWQRLFGQ